MPSDKAKELVALLSRRGLTITAAESLTGGRIAAAITAVPGSSSVFPGGIVSYCDRVKHQVLGVAQETLDQYGAVSAQTAREMAAGAAKVLGADLALSATGLAGPEGDGSDNPVGTVFLGLWARGAATAQRRVFAGTRQEIQEQSVETALEMALECLRQWEQEETQCPQDD